MPITFEWDTGKEKSNRAKHGIGFPEAATVFADPLSLTISDPEHSIIEDRYITLGVSFQRRLLVVAHTEAGDRIRIISARRATGVERRQYEEEET
jgi:hypothetical protein